MTASELHFTIGAFCESHVELRSAAFSDTKVFQLPLDNSCAPHRAQRAHSACACTYAGRSEDGRAGRFGMAIERPRRSDKHPPNSRPAEMDGAGIGSSVATASSESGLRS